MNNHPLGGAVIQNCDTMTALSITHMNSVLISPYSLAHFISQIVQQNKVCINECVHTHTHQSPQGPLLLGDDGSGTRCVVHKCQLSKAALVIVLTNAAAHATLLHFNIIHAPATETNNTTLAQLISLKLKFMAFVVPIWQAPFQDGLGFRSRWVTGSTGWIRSCIVMFCIIMLRGETKPTPTQYQLGTVSRW